MLILFLLINACFNSPSLKYKAVESEGYCEEFIALLGDLKNRDSDEISAIEDFFEVEAKSGRINDTHNYSFDIDNSRVSKLLYLPHILFLESERIDLSKRLRDKIVKSFISKYMTLESEKRAQYFNPDNEGDGVCLIHLLTIYCDITTFKYALKNIYFKNISNSLSRDMNGSDSLLLAASVGSRDKLSLLLKSGAKIGRDDKSRNVVAYVFWAGKLDMLKVLLRYGVDVDTPFQNSRLYPTTFAGIKRQSEIINFALAYGIKCDTQLEARRKKMMKMVANRVMGVTAEVTGSLVGPMEPIVGLAEKITKGLLHEFITLSLSDISREEAANFVKSRLIAGKWIEDINIHREESEEVLKLAVKNLKEVDKSRLNDIRRLINNTKSLSTRTIRKNVKMSLLSIMAARDRLSLKRVSSSLFRASSITVDRLGELLLTNTQVGNSKEMLDALGDWSNIEYDRPSIDQIREILKEKPEFKEEKLFISSPMVTYDEYAVAIYSQGSIRYIDPFSSERCRYMFVKIGGE